MATANDPRDPAPARKKVLIVDDNQEMVSAIIRILLPVKQLVCDAVYDGAAALEKARIFQPDLILLDIRMPGLDGYEVCAMIRRESWGRDAKIIIISGALDMDGVEKVAKMGANDFLAKPFRSEFLRIKVERILGL